MEADEYHDMPFVRQRIGKASAVIHAESESLRSGGSLVEVPIGVWMPKNQECVLKSKGRTRWMPQLKQKDSEFTFLPPFCSVRALSGLEDAHSHWWRQSPLLSPLSLLSVFPHRQPRNNILPAILASLGTVKLTHKIAITVRFLYLLVREESAPLGC